MKDYAYRCGGVVVIVSMFWLAGTFPAGAQERFTSSDDAIKALSTAVSNRDTNTINLIFGPALKGLVSPDPVQSSNSFTVFRERFAQKVQPVQQSDSRIVLNLGADAWPFPIPLVKQDGQWIFDTAAGQEEILNRRVGRNELDTISVCHAYVEAQRDYASEDRLGDHVLAYAQQLRSTPGRHDGLYWHAEPGEPISPLGPLIAQARGEGYTHKTKIMTESQVPYHGYFFKVLTRQGPNAPGGKYNYIINGRMIAGFALVAWPAQWGNSGVMTFIVNQEGRVYERNLGPKTDAIARKMKAYDPDPLWRPAEE
ncbi:MAG: DUF2950 domain-containing protein [Limisphaerales bacterium]